MAKGTTDALAGSFVDSAKYVVDVAHVEVRVSRCEFMRPPPACFVLEHPLAIFRLQIGEIHVNSFAH